jgi:hypothetical protein
MKKIDLDVSKAIALAPAGSYEGRDISILPILALDPQLQPFRDAAVNVKAQADRAVIDSEEAWQRGSDFLTVCSEQWDQLEALRKAVKKPIDDYGKFIQTLFVPLQTQFALAKTTVSERMRLFQKAEEAKRAAAAAAVQKANEEAAAKLAEEAEKRGDTAAADAILQVATLAPVTPAPMRLGGTNSFGKSTNTVKRWTGTVDNPMDVLRAILDGKLPISIVGSWSQVEINKVATSLKVEKTVHGLKLFQSENIQQR